MRWTVAIVLMASSVAQAGLFTDWWVPADGHCPINPESEETRVAAADDVTSCRQAHSTQAEDGSVKVDWTGVIACMTERGWERHSRADWEAWNLRCERKAQDEASLYVVITEELVQEYVEQGAKPVASGSLLLSIPPGLLGRVPETPDPDLE